jgi:tocopherol O-methyltransferase
MHHGYYAKNGQPKSNQQAQIDMIEEVLSWAGVTTVKNVGCCLLSALKLCLKHASG